MLGVLKRRWKPKRASNSNNNNNRIPTDTTTTITTTNNTANNHPLQLVDHPQTDNKTPPRIPPSSVRQVHPLCDEKAQLLAYDKPPPPVPPLPTAARTSPDTNHHPLPPRHVNKRSSLDNNQQHYHRHKPQLISPDHSPPPYQKRASVELTHGGEGYVLGSPLGSDRSSGASSNATSYPIVPNICVAGGRIEFIKSPVEDVHEGGGGFSAGVNNVAPPVPEARITVTRGLQTEDVVEMMTMGGVVLATATTTTLLDEEKYDDEKEQLVEKISELEDELANARKAEMREKATILKLQRQLSRRETAHRDADRERRLRVDSESRTKQALQEAARCRSRLKLLTNEFSRMEESVRSMLVYKKQAEQLRQEKAALTIAFENRCQQYQASITRLNQEILTLRQQLDKPFLFPAGSDVGGAIQPNVDYSQSTLLQRHVEEARKQYEKCLDDVANQVVRALVAQKGLKEEVTTLNARIQELETQNGALTSMLVHQLRSADNNTTASLSPQPLSLVDSSRTVDSVASSLADNNTSADVSPVASATIPVPVVTTSATPMRTSLTYKHCNSFNSDVLERSPCQNDMLALGDEVERTISRIEKHLSADSDILETRFSVEDKKRHQVLTQLWTDLKGTEVTPKRLIEALSAVDSALWVPPKRPMSLNLQIPILQTTTKYRRTRPVLSQSISKSSDDTTTTSSSSITTVSTTSTNPVGNNNTHPNNVTTTSTSHQHQDHESPESGGNRDEGYSTMSSDVQTETVTTVRHGSVSSASCSTIGGGDTLSGRGERMIGLEDLKEAMDETEFGSRLLVADCRDPDVLYIPLNLLNLKPRNSYPPGKDLLPFQHIMRSFSDSHLCIKITTAPSPCFSFSSPISSSPSILLLDITEKKSNPLRRTKATTSLLTNTNLVFTESTTSPTPPSTTWSTSTDDRLDAARWDAEYIQHWLRLDETRSLLQQQQQQQRDLLELEYDTTDLEDWSLSLPIVGQAGGDDGSGKDVEVMQWRNGGTGGGTASTTPGQISLSTLPSIQENNALELEEDVNECLWNSSSYMVDKEGHEIVTVLMDRNTSGEQQWPYAVNYHLNLNNSPDNSWSSAGSDYCQSHEPETFSKRSSAALSGCSDDTGELPAIGTDFTRDFYRLVKFESTKSLASTSSRSLGGCNGVNSALSDHPVLNTAPVTSTAAQPPPSGASADRETALQNVLTFIAEQQKYVQAREDAVTQRCCGGGISADDVQTKEFNVEAPPQQMKDIRMCDCDRDLYICTSDKVSDDENYVTLKQLCTEYTLNEQNTSRNNLDDSNSPAGNLTKKPTELPKLATAENNIHIAYAEEVCLAAPLDCADESENCAEIAERPVDICRSVGVALASMEYQNGVFSTEASKQETDEEVVEKRAESLLLLNGCEVAEEQLEEMLRSVDDEGVEDQVVVDVDEEEELVQSTISSDSNNLSESLTTSSVSTPDTIVSKIPRRKPSVSRIPVSPAKIINGSPTRSPHSTPPPSHTSPSHTPPPCKASPPTFPSSSSTSITITSRIPQKKPPSRANTRTPPTKQPITRITPPVVNHHHVITSERLPVVTSGILSTTTAEVIATNNGTATTVLLSDSPASSSSMMVDSKATTSRIIDGPPHRAVSFHERATSKDVIEELNRMIRNGDGEGSSQEFLDTAGGDGAGCANGVTKLDEACKPTGWIHVERDVDLNDPKMRANLLDVMMASVSSDSSPTSSCGGSVTSESIEEPPDYGQLHRIHKYHRQKKVLHASRPGGALAQVVRATHAPLTRPTIIGRPEFYLRYGEKEREAVASFDFLDDELCVVSATPSPSSVSVTVTPSVSITD